VLGGARSPVGVPPRLFLGMSEHPRPASGQASWDAAATIILLSGRYPPLPVPVQRHPRPATYCRRHDAQSRPGDNLRDCPRAPHSPRMSDRIRIRPEVNEYGACNLNSDKCQGECLNLRDNSLLSTTRQLFGISTTDLAISTTPSGVPVAEAKQRVFDVDTRAIRQCDVLVIVLDGRSVDEGACFELGFAFGIGKACVGLKTDVRSLFSFGDNPMIEAALQHIFFSDQELFDWLRCFAQCNRSRANH
jgi:hypothetical protein